MINKIYLVIRKIIKILRYQLILTLLFSCVYATIYKYNSDSFTWSRDPPNFMEYIYFSFQTQSTVGESGSLPMSNGAKIAVCLQIITTMASVMNVIKSIDKDIIKENGKKKNIKKKKNKLYRYKH